MWFFLKFHNFFHFNISTSNLRDKNKVNVITISSEGVLHTLHKYYYLISYLLSLLSRTLTFPNGPKTGLSNSMNFHSISPRDDRSYHTWLKEQLCYLKVVGRDFKISILLKRYRGKIDFRTPQKQLSRAPSTMNSKFRNSCRPLLELLMGYLMMSLSFVEDDYSSF